MDLQVEKQLVDTFALYIYWIHGWMCTWTLARDIGAIFSRVSGHKLFVQDLCFRTVVTMYESILVFQWRNTCGFLSLTLDVWPECLWLFLWKIADHFFHILSVGCSKIPLGLTLDLLVHFPVGRAFHVLGFSECSVFGPSGTTKLGIHQRMCMSCRCPFCWNMVCLGGLPRNSVARLTDRARNDLRCVEGP